MRARRQTAHKVSTGSGHHKRKRLTAAPRLARTLPYNARFRKGHGFQALRATRRDHHPHPVPFYIFKSPNGVRFQRPIFMQQLGSSSAQQDSSKGQQDSSSPFSCSNSVPAAHSRIPARDSRIPAAHFLAAARFQQRTAGFHVPAVTFAAAANEKMCCMLSHFR